ncbi:hypothetical protein MBLNU230_g4920t1 [Neophaeotheca triangularis]
MSSLRLLPRHSAFALQSHQLQHRLIKPIFLRHASTTPPPKPRVLEKPERFNPPSHPSRLPRKNRQYPGAPLSEHERQAQKTRRYPNMMPPEGTLTHTILTNRNLHLYITLGILISLVLGTWFLDFLHNTPFKDQLPPNSMFWAHPFQFAGRYMQVYDLHVAWTSEQTAAMRKQKVEDAGKRREYRKAHGLEEEGSKGFLGRWLKADEEETKEAAEAAAVREGGNVIDATPVAADVRAPEEGDTVVGVVKDAVSKDGETYVDFEGKERPVQKKWFGIW